MKKYLILAAVAAFTFASCAKVETPATVAEKHAIGFTNYAPKNIAKAGSSYVSGNAFATDAQFAVYGWSTAYGNFLGVNPGTPAFMNPAVVTWKNDVTTGENNTYSPIRYWPSGDEPDNLSFTAYYPYGGAGITAPTFSTGVGTYAFEAQSAAANMVDFCVADVVNDQVYEHTNAGASYPQTVKFTFKHQLAKIQFKFKKAADVDANTTIKLVEAKLINVKTSGTLTATYAQNSTPAVNALGTTTTAWSGQAVAATPVEYEVFVNGSDPSTSNKIELSTTLTSVVDGDLFLMIPQAMVDKAGTNPQALVITWEVITGGVTTTNTKTLYFKNDLKNGDDPSATGYAALEIDWAKNNFITYNITIGPKPIWFTAEVAAWDAEQNGYFNVN